MSVNGQAATSYFVSRGTVAGARPRSFVVTPVNRQPIGPGSKRRCKMLTNFQTATGPLESFLDCPGCGFYGTVYYTTKIPVYCSNACRQRAARQRKNERAGIENVSRLADTFSETAARQDFWKCFCSCRNVIYVSRFQLDNGPAVSCPSCYGRYLPDNEAII